MALFLSGCLLGALVLAAATRIPGTPWNQVPRAYGIGMSAWIAITLALAGALVVVLGFCWRWRDTRTSFAVQELEQEKRALEDRYAHLMDQACDSILVSDPAGRILEANQAACSLYGHSPEAFQTMVLSDLRPPEGQADFKAQFSQVRSGATLRFEAIHMRAGGVRFPVEVSARQVDFGGTPIILSFIRDITVRRTQEAEISRMVRLYEALSQVNQAIVKAKDRAELMSLICKVMVEHGKFTMAWIGRGDPVTRQVAVIAQHGDTTGYLDGIVVRTDDTPEGRGPTGSALRTGTTRIFRDHQNHPDFTPWRTRAEKAGFASSGAFPIFQKGSPVAVLTVYASEADFFGPHEMALLEEAAGDVSFALEKMDAEEQRLRNEKIQAALYHIAVDTLEAPSIQGLFRRIHTTLAEVVPARNFYIAKHDEASGMITFPYFVDEVDPPPPPRKPGLGLTDLVLRKGQAFHLTHADMETLEKEGAVQVVGSLPVDWVGVPLTLQGAVFGVMVAQSYTPGVVYAVEDVEFLQFVATQVAASISRKQAEESLRASEEKFSTIFNGAPLLGAVTRHVDGTFVEVNDLYCQSLGYAREELIGRTTLDLGIINPADRERILAFVAHATQAPNMELTLRAKDGHPIPCLMSGEVVEVGTEKLVVLMLADITSLKQGERDRQLLQAEVDHMQKLESLGRLAGGVAHDMNNVLGAILAVTQTVRTLHGEDAALDGALATVERAATRGRDLVKGLMGFTRKDLAATTALDINALVREEMALLERTLLQKYRLVMDLEEPLPSVMGETGTLGSALMNLCVNAVDAMPGGGTLTIRTRLEGELLEVSVEDTGEGMAPEVLKRAMEPFFTTKPMGKGTGLGLAMVFSTARAHGGSLMLQSREGEGTCARLRLPYVHTQPVAPGSGGPADAAGDGLDILLVDDDELLRAAMPGMLRILGHRVEAVDGGRPALERLDAGASPDLVILDMNMPDLTGLATLREIRARRPDLPVLLATGFLEAEAEAVLESDPRTLAITKPFSLDEIRHKLQELQFRSAAPDA